MLPAHDDPRAPKFWMNETGGLLGPAIERYLWNKPERANDASLIQAYLRQWIDSPVWDLAPDTNDKSQRALAELRRCVRAIRTRSDIARWLSAATLWGIDPL
jgi:hypothetical protein